MNWQTALILYCMLCVAVPPFLIFGKGLEMALLGKAYRPTFAILAAVLLFALAWYSPAVRYALFIVAFVVAAGWVTLMPFR